MSHGDTWWGSVQITSAQGCADNPSRSHLFMALTVGPPLSFAWKGHNVQQLTYSTCNHRKVHAVIDAVLLLENCLAIYLQDRSDACHDTFLCPVRVHGMSNHKMQSLVSTTAKLTRSVLEMTYC